ncbi:MAG TPA: hypothetical protein VKK61_06630 [Tepidisphaeraceae bacterium]|jgi:hypothetical protein|nr:hypothetical protein [Tepidisphaeraceae bacterium]
MNSKTITIGFLSISALILFIAQFIPITPAALAADTIKDRDYSLATAASAQGGDVIYVCENHTGALAAFAWDPTTRNLQPRGGVNLADAFR